MDLASPAVSGTSVYANGLILRMTMQTITGFQQNTITARTMHVLIRVYPCLKKKTARQTQMYVLDTYR